MIPREDFDVHTFSGYFPVILVRNCDALARPQDAEEVAYLDTKTASILSTLQRDQEIRLQAFVIPPNRDQAMPRKSQRPSTNTTRIATHCLCVNIYGSSSLGEALGAFASRCKLFLQDPRNCDRNVEYLNPHRMPLQEVVFTHSLHFHVPDPMVPEIEIRKPQDIFRDFELDGTIDETDPPAMLKSILQSYVYSI